MTQKERMLKGLPYRASDPELRAEHLAAKQAAYVYNHLEPGSADTEPALRRIFGKLGENPVVQPPFHCDYGKNIEAGDWFFANFNCIILDVGPVKIGHNVMFAPNVAIYTAGHPVHPDSRNSGYEYGIGVTIGDNVWIGGNTVVNPGVNIGNNVVIGSGSVVTKDLPDNVIAAGNPCRVMREITDRDRDYYFKDRRFDVEDYK